jgi:Right handed beta helix region
VILMRLSLSKQPLAALLCLSMLSCGSEDTPDGPTLGCADQGTQGVPLEAVCSEASCTGNVACSEVIEVAAGADLAAAAASAVSGSCLAVAPGTYGDVALPSGVSLLGRWADEVTVGAISVASGGANTIRGITATSVQADGVATLVFEQSRVTAGVHGVAVAGAGAVEIACSEVTGAADHGVLATDTSNLTVRRSYLHDIGGPGLWVACSEGCGCSSVPDVSLTDVTVERARHAGVHFAAVDAVVRDVAITDTNQRPGMAGGVGLSAACGSVDVQGLYVDGAVEAGVLLQDTTGNLGAPGQEAGIIIINGKRGLWLSGDAGVTAQGFEISAAGGIGVGIDAESKGIIIINGKVEDTAAAQLPVAGGGTQSVGDGLLWMTGAEVSITGLSLSNSARAALLIDGEVAAGSTLTDVTLLGSDASFGIVQQGVQMGATAPMVGSNTPAVTQQSDATFAIPEPPSTPAAL